MGLCYHNSCEVQLQPSGSDTRTHPNYRFSSVSVTRFSSVSVTRLQVKKVIKAMFKLTHVTEVQP